MKNMLLLSFAYTEFDFVFFADLLNMRVLMISHKIKLRKSFKIIRFLTKKQLFSKFTLFRSSQLWKSFLHLKWIYLLDSLQGVEFFFPYIYHKDVTEALWERFSNWNKPARLDTTTGPSWHPLDWLDLKFSAMEPPLDFSVEWAKVLGAQEIPQNRFAISAQGVDNVQHRDDFHNGLRQLASPPGVPPGGPVLVEFYFWGLYAINTFIVSLPLQYYSLLATHLVTTLSNASWVLVDWKSVSSISRLSFISRIRAVATSDSAAEYWK